MYRVNKSGGFNVPFGRYTNPKICDEVNLGIVNRTLQNVEIEHCRYNKVLKHTKAGGVIYFDLLPPYQKVVKWSKWIVGNKKQYCFTLVSDTP